MHDAIDVKNSLPFHDRSFHFLSQNIIRLKYKCYRCLCLVTSCFIMCLFHQVRNLLNNPDEVKMVIESGKRDNLYSESQSNISY